MDVQFPSFLLDAILYAVGLGTALTLFLPFSPMTIDLVNLSRGVQTSIYRYRALLWSLAGVCLGLLLLRGLNGALDQDLASAPAGAYHWMLAASSTAWSWAAIATSGVLAVLFWSGYVPFVMTPPSRQQILSVAGADQTLAPHDVVLGVVCGTQVRAYPRATIARPHYFVDTLADTPLMISYCILCNSALAFKAELDGRRLQLKCVTAYNNNIIYHEPATGNFIQQIDGTVFEGPDAGKALDTYPVTLSLWSDWKQRYPQTTLFHAPAVRWRDRLVARMLETLIPIAKLSKRSKPWHRIRGHLDRRLPAMSLVIGVESAGEACAYPVDAVRLRRVLDDVVGATPITLFHDAAHDLSAVFLRQVDARTLNFVPAQGAGGRVVACDRETGTLWAADGMALQGPLRGRALAPVPHVNKLFWFSWAIFKPATRVAAQEAASIAAAG